ncbi:polysaccharide lyase [Aliiglaciecola sp. SL4]|uniref:polysaccharide lyase n=1 Tax=Aliiglaciecola sp. SL4 TaxID=3239806 RepID=UPI00355BEBEA
MKNLFIFCYFLVFFALPSKAEIFDNSVTYNYASNAARIYWPEGNFAKFHKQYAQHINKFDVQDVDREHTVSIDLSSVKLTNPLVLTLSAAPGNKGVTDFFSVEKGGYKAPQLTFLEGDKKRLLLAEIDTFVAKKNRKPSGSKPIVKAGGGHTVLLKFQFTENIDLNSLKQLKLLLTTTNRQYGKSSLQTHQIHYVPPSRQPNTEGIASKYPLDKGIEQDSAVYYADDFNKQSWLSDIKQSIGISEPIWQNTGGLQFVEHQQVRHFSGQPGNSVKMPFTTSRNLAGNLDFYFAKQSGSEPEEAYFRYYSMLAPGAKVSGGGKLPGFGGTYNKAGWGGRANNGKNGWSARGSFFKSVSPSNTDWGGRMPIGSYIYEVDTRNKYGKSIPWGDELSTMQPGRWYAIEQYVKLNSPGKKNGIFKVWIDGVLIYERHNMHFRDTEKLKIEKVWLNYYFGGVAKPKNNFNMYLDNIVIASSYIGPIRK